MPDKELHEWTFDELVDFCAGRALHGLLKGQALRSLVWEACELAARWNAGQSKK